MWMPLASITRLFLISSSLLCASPYAETNMRAYTRAETPRKAPTGSFTSKRWVKASAGSGSGSQASPTSHTLGSESIRSSVGASSSESPSALMMSGIQHPRSNGDLRFSEEPSVAAAIATRCASRSRVAKSSSSPLRATTRDGRRLRTPAAAELEREGESHGSGLNVQRLTGVGPPFEAARSDPP